MFYDEELSEINSPINYVINEFEGYKELIMTNSLGNKIYYITEMMRVDNLSNSQIPLSFYPNPANNFITINSRENILSVSVYNIHGKLVKNVHRQNKIDIADLPEAVYVIQIQTETRQVLKNIIKN